MVIMLLKRWSSKVFFTGAGGQIGAELIKVAQEKYGDENVLATDLKDPSPLWKITTLFDRLDVTDASKVQKVISSFKPNIIYHLASTLSAPSELNPQLALKVNLTGLHNILEQARICNAKIFAASSIASYGATTPKIPNDIDVQRPSTIYGITKVHLELLGEYYNSKHGVDFRCLRVPIVTSEAMPGGGSAAFTVTIFYDLLKTGKCVIPVSRDARMPLIYLPDLIRAIQEFMDADNKNLHLRTYTMSSAGTSVGEYVDEVLKHVKGEVEYKPDFRDPIIKSWPDGTNSTGGYLDWGHKIHYDVPRMVRSMYENISRNLAKE
jgi:threonine 3-dehydrogenase